MPTVTKNPTSTEVIVPWANPTNAYTENSVYAECSGIEAIQKYGGWNFTSGDIPEGSTITKVELGAKHASDDDYPYLIEGLNLQYVDSLGQLHTSVNYRNGYPTFRYDWFDITTFESTWDLAKLNALDGRIKYRDLTGGGDLCFIENELEKTYFLGKTPDGKWVLKTPSQLKKGDLLFVADFKTHKYLTTPIKDILVKEGMFEVIEIWTGRLKIKTPIGEKLWKTHLTVTENHPILTFNLPNMKAHIMRADDVYAAFLEGHILYMAHLWADIVGSKDFYGKFQPITFVAKKTYHGKVYDVKIENPDLRMFFKCLFPHELKQLTDFQYPLSRQCELGPPFLMAVPKGTLYVDVVAVRVTYTPPLVGLAFNLGDGLTNQVVVV